MSELEIKNIDCLLGKVFTKVYADYNLELVFKNQFEKISFYHDQDCFEQVTIEDICGDLKDLIGVPILVAEQSHKEGEENFGYPTWTFYTFRTIKGTVSVRWFGCSFYSSEVHIHQESIVKIEPDCVKYVLDIPNEIMDRDVDVEAFISHDEKGQVIINTGLYVQNDGTYERVPNNNYSKQLLEKNSVS